MVSPELGTRAPRQLGSGPQASQARPLEKGATPAHCYNRRTHLETRVLREGAVLLLLGMGLEGGRVCQHENSVCQQRHRRGSASLGPAGCLSRRMCAGDAWGRRATQ